MNLNDPADNERTVTQLAAKGYSTETIARMTGLRPAAINKIIAATTKKRPK